MCAQLLQLGTCKIWHFYVLEQFRFSGHWIINSGFLVQEFKVQHTTFLCPEIVTCIVWPSVTNGLLNCIIVYTSKCSYATQVKFWINSFVLCYDFYTSISEHSLCNDIKPVPIAPCGICSKIGTATAWWLHGFLHVHVQWNLS